MNICISNGGEENSFLFINIKKKTTHDSSSQAPLGQVGKATSLDDSSWAVRPELVANMGTQAIKNRWLSQGEPEAPLLGRSVSKAFNKIWLTFWVISEALVMGSKKVRGLSLVLVNVNMKKTLKDRIIMGGWGKGGGQRKPGSFRIPGQKRSEF